MGFQSSRVFFQVDCLIPWSEGLNINTCIYLFNQQTGQDNRALWGDRGNSLEASACPVPPSVLQSWGPLPFRVPDTLRCLGESQDLLIT